MFGLKHTLDTLEITILNTEYYRVGQEWNYQHVNNPYSRLYFVTEGYGKVTHHNQTFDLRPGGLYLIPCFTTVDMTCPNQFRHYYIHFTSRIQTGLDIFSILNTTYETRARDHGIDHTLLHRLVGQNPNRELSEYDATKPIYRQVLERVEKLDQRKSAAQIVETNAIMRLLLSPFLMDQDHPQTANTLHGLSRFKDVFEYIHNHLDAPITLEAMAELVNLNPTYFSNLFARLMGMPPIQYINRRRIEKAQQLLLSSNEPLYRIATQVGFKDVYYFSRLFKQYVGLAPSFYQKRRQL
ncbi:MAG: helix-turn-helix domain-containing protein [Planctomycetes bacterium]|nr:helix-turn-helix domain-containing protein [Planctomycetota bacterium]